MADYSESSSRSDASSDHGGSQSSSTTAFDVSSHSERSDLTSGAGDNGSDRSTTSGDHSGNTADSSSRSERGDLSSGASAGGGASTDAAWHSPIAPPSDGGGGISGNVDGAGYSTSGKAADAAMSVGSPPEGGGGMSGNADGAGYSTGDAHSTSDAMTRAGNPESAPMTGDSHGSPYEAQGTGSVASSEKVTVGVPDTMHIGPKDPASYTHQPSSDTYSPSTPNRADRMEAGGAIGQTIGEYLGKEFGPNGERAVGAVGKEYGQAAGAVFDSVEAAVKHEVETVGVENLRSD